MSVFFGRKAVVQDRALSFQDVWGSGASVTDTPGVSGIVTGGLRLIPVYSATSLIADLVSTAPLVAYRKSPDGSIAPLAQQPQLVINPAPRGTLIDWLHQALASLLLRGNAYGYVLAWDSQGRPSKIIWLHPDQVTVVEEQVDWLHTPQYSWRGVPLDISRVVHIPAYTFPGSVIGLSPLALFKLQIETGMRAQQFGDDWFKNGASPSGVLKNSSKVLTPDEAATAKQRFKSSVQKRDPFVTGSDWSYESLAVKANESQFLETIKATATQVAAIYRVSPEDIGGDTGKSMTYKTLEQDNTKLTQRTLSVWSSRIGAALSDLMPRPQSVGFDLDAVSSGDRTSRMVAHAAALTIGVETNSEARASEKKPPLSPEEVDFWQTNYRSKVDAAMNNITKTPETQGEK